ncbi:MAG: hypothetical protein AAGF67_16400 [Verrucomicrobiota bacterium]
MNFQTVALALALAFSAPLLAEESRSQATPNPVKAGFPDHWNASSWDTKEGAKFWSRPAPASKKKSTSPAKPLPSPQLNDFRDRQSEK